MVKPPILDVLEGQGLPNPTLASESRLESDLRRLEAYYQDAQRLATIPMFYCSPLGLEGIEPGPGMVIPLEDLEEDPEYDGVYPNPFERR